LSRSRCLAAARHLPWLAVTLVVAAGCTRSFFRERADRDVEALLAEKSVDPRWTVEAWHVYPDNRARFADFDDPDRPKKPPDDPGVAALSPDPQPFRSKFCSGPDQEGHGYLEFLRHCDQHNRTLLAEAKADDDRPMATLGLPQAESPAGDALAELQRSLDAALRVERQGYLINLEQSLELSLFNSREFQNRREDLYVTALPVTLERFQFVTQFFAGVQAIRDWTASGVPGGPSSSWDITSTGRATQLFPSGAALVTNLAHRVFVDLTTGNPSVGLSNLTLELTQPLLRGGGWAVTLENLTQAERNLVYGVRSYARFRKNYFVYIAGGGDLGNGVFGFDGLFGPGGPLSPTAPSQGYLPTLLAAAQERNERENIRALTGYFTLYREYQGRGDFSELQVGQVEQQILGSQSALLATRQNVQGALDAFKLQLGLPTQTTIELDDGPLKPVRDILADFTRARDEYQGLRAEADRFRSGLRMPLQALAGSAVAPIPLDVPLRDKLTELVFDSPVTRATKVFRESIRERWGRWLGMTTLEVRAEIKRLADELRELQVREARAEALGELMPPAEVARLAVLPPDIALGQLELSLRAYDAARIKRDAATVRDVAVLYEDSVNNFMRVMNEPRMERRALMRAAWPDLPAISVDGLDLLEEDLEKAQTVAGQVALANRLELMNARGVVVDAWRQITVQANSLLGVLNVGYNFTSPSDENQPFALGGPRSRHQLILTGELPLVRRGERNNYRTALIVYQRARRNLQATEDFILNDVRTDLRNLRVLAENYRLQQRAVELAYDQVENSLDVLQAPPQPEAGGAEGARPGRAGQQTQQQAGNAASLTNQLLSQQNALLRAQNALYTVWVNYLIARMTFYRDIERLPLDPRGVWIDEPCSPPGVQPETLPDPVPVESADTGRFGDLRADGGR
jgi:hypothetical protein